jgi:hypothetical protein
MQASEATRLREIENAKLKKLLAEVSRVSQLAHVTH